jgi:membrane fusion protein (multidrug efflux system)
VILAVSFTMIPRWVRLHASEARYARTEDAQVQGELRPLSPRVFGYVVQTPVEDYQAVEAGQPILIIEQSNFQAQLRLSQATVLQQRRTVRELAAQVAQLRATAAQARALLPGDEQNLRYAKAELWRASQLAPTGAAAKAVYDQALAQEKTAASTLQHDREAALAAARQVSVTREHIRVTEALVQQAEAQRDLDALNLAWTVLRAPSAGVLDRRDAWPGQLIQPGTPVNHFTPLDSVWVQANFRETVLARVQPHQHVEIHVDMFPRVTLHGEVAGLAPATGSATAMIPSENATGNFTKIVQRVPLKIVLWDEGGPLRGRLRPGMNVEVRIDTDSGPGPARTGRGLR